MPSSRKSTQSKMPKECTELGQTITSILNDNVYMCHRIIDKSKILVESAKIFDELSVDKVTVGVEKLLDRIQTNITDFRSRYESARDKYKQATLSHRKKSNLSLKRNGTIQETDVDLTNSDGENDKSAQVNGTKEIDAGNAETDSKRSIPLGHFDASVARDSKEVAVTKETLDGSVIEILDETFKTSGEIEEAKLDAEVASFDFSDAEDDLNARLDKSRNVAGDADECKRQNHELLEMLNKVTDNQGRPIEVYSEGDADLALELLDADVSCSSAGESDDTMSAWSESDEASDGWKPTVRKTSDAASEVGKVTDEEPSDTCRPVTVKLPRVDHLRQSEIDRLCDLNNINSRKCGKTLRKHKSPKKKRMRVLSKSSSSSSESEMSLEGSTTPDLNLADRGSPVDPVLDNIDDLADGICANLSNSEDESATSSGSETDAEGSTKKQKKLVEELAKSEGDENKSYEIEVEPKMEEKEEMVTKEKKRGTWRDDALLASNLWTSSDSEIDSDWETPPMKKSKTSKDEGLTTVISYAGPTTVISDTDSENDVTFVNENDTEEIGGNKGRRNIRAILSDKELSAMTQKAKDEEDQRIQRLEELSKTMELIQSQHEDFVLDVDVDFGTPLIVVDANLTVKLKPHQRAGIKFMWQACYENVRAIKNEPGTGCILAHCMGLGKTLQVITLIHTLVTHEITNTKHVLVVCPLSTVSNWRNEFRLAFKYLKSQPLIQLFFLIKEDVHEKSKMVNMWRLQGGVLVMGYEAFQNLTSEKKKQLSEQTKEQLRLALLNPGPDLIVCDEGHLLKNGGTLRAKALMEVRTKRRIVLTGTPLQNNLVEYYYMVQFVKPHLLGTLAEYKNRFVYPIVNGQYHNSLPGDIQLMKKRTHVLTTLLKKTIDRVETAVLAEYLPELTDYTLFVKLSPVQESLYKRYIQLVQGANGPDRRTYFHDVRMTGFICLHPYALHLYYSEFKKRKRRKERETVNDDDVDEISVQGINEGWYDELCPVDVRSNFALSDKFRVMLGIIDETMRKGEKVLIFAHFLVELDAVEHFLQMHKTDEGVAWENNVNYYRMDGTVSPDKRSSLCKKFNVNSSIRIFLISHRVGGLGLNLTAASRVILIGTNFNPSHDTQSIYRVYRFGQTKQCFVYRLLSLGTMEERLYRQCVLKLAVAGTVVDKQHFERRYTPSDLQEMYVYNFDYGERTVPAVPTDKLLAKLLQTSGDIHEYLTHKALLENRPEEELNEEEKRLAWDEFNKVDSAPVPKNVGVTPVPQKLPPFQAMLKSLPIFPVNLEGFNRFGQYCGGTTNMVPNPLNSSARGLVPRLPVNRKQNGGFDENFLKYWASAMATPPIAHRVQRGATGLATQSPDIPALDLTVEPIPSEFNYALNTVV